MVIMPKGASWVAYSLLLFFLTAFTLLLAFKIETFKAIGGKARRGIVKIAIKLGRSFDVNN